MRGRPSLPSGRAHDWPEPLPVEDAERQRHGQKRSQHPNLYLKTYKLVGVFFVALMGLAPVVATASFPLINLPKFYLSFTILVSLILVKYPDRVGLVNTVPYTV